MGEFFVMLHQIKRIIDDLDRNAEGWKKALTESQAFMEELTAEVIELRAQNKLLNANIEMYREIHQKHEKYWELVS